MCDHLHLCVNATLAAPKQVAVAKVEEPEANGLVCLLCEIEIETIAVCHVIAAIVMKTTIRMYTGPRAQEPDVCRAGEGAGSRVRQDPIRVQGV